MSPADNDVDPAGTRVTFDHQGLGARFLCRQRRAQAGGAGADDQQRHLRVEA